MSESSESVELVVEKDESVPIVHQLGKLVVGTVVGFIATQLAGMAYDAIRERANSHDDVTDLIDTKD